MRRSPVRVRTIRYNVPWLVEVLAGRPPFDGEVVVVAAYPTRALALSHAKRLRAALKPEKTK